MRRELFDQGSRWTSRQAGKNPLEAQSSKVRHEHRKKRVDPLPDVGMHS